MGQAISNNSSQNQGATYTNEANTQSGAASAADQPSLTSQEVENFSYRTPPTDPSSATFGVQATLYQATHSSSNGLTQDQKDRLAYADTLRSQGHAEAAYVVEASVAQDWIETGGSAGNLTTADTVFNVQNSQTGKTDSYDLESLILKGTSSSADSNGEPVSAKQEALNNLISSGDLSTMDVQGIGEFLQNANLFSESQADEFNSWDSYSNQAHTSYTKSYAQIMKADVVINTIRGLTGDSNPLADDLQETTIQNSPFAAKQMYWSETIEAFANESINDPVVKARLDQISSRADYWQTSYNTLLQMLTR